MITRPTDTEEATLIAMVDWAREFLATEVEGQYTSDAALHLALFMIDAHRRSPPNPLDTKPGGYLP